MFRYLLLPSQNQENGQNLWGKTPVRVVAVPVIFATICAAAIVLWKAVTAPTPTPVVFTAEGPVQGNVRYSRDGKEFWEFLGIPYAVPPVGPRKFQPPVPVEPWGDEVKHVTDYPPSCAQFDALITGRVMGELDCLYLNVFVSVFNGNETKKPVLVFIYGGAFVSGGTKLYHPDYFMDQDIVLVVMNYRVGPFGFLNLPHVKDPEGPRGNMGLKDQHLALQWVKRNIEKFGGNSESITLVGESAGAMSALLHVLSPQSQGLFHKVIAQSSSALVQWGLSTQPAQVAKDYAKRLGCSVETWEEVWKCYQDMEWRDLVKEQHSLLEPLQRKDIFEPSIEDTFLTRLPFSVMEAGEFPAVPVMYGVNPGEGGLRTARFDAMPVLISELDTKWKDVLHNLMASDIPFPVGVAEKIRNQYFGGNWSFTEDVHTFMTNMTDMISDSGFFEPVHRAAVWNAQKGAPTFMFYFNYTSKILPGTYSALRAARLGRWLPQDVYIAWYSVIDWVSEHLFGGKGSRIYGICHSESIYQLWNAEGRTKWFSSYDAEFSRAFVQVLTDFARDTKHLKFRGLEWTPINAHLDAGKDEYTIPYMLLDNEDQTKLIPEPFGHRIKFFDQLDGWRNQFKEKQ